MEDYLDKCYGCPMMEVAQEDKMVDVNTEVQAGNWVCKLTGKQCRDMDSCPEELDQ